MAEKITHVTGPDYFECVLQCGRPCISSDSIDKITTTRWNNIKDKSMLWKGLNPFGDVLIL